MLGPWNVCQSLRLWYISAWNWNEETTVSHHLRTIGRSLPFALSLASICATFSNPSLKYCKWCTTYFVFEKWSIELWTYAGSRKKHDRSFIFCRTEAKTINWSQLTVVQSWWYRSHAVVNANTNRWCSSKQWHNFLPLERIIQGSINSIHSFFYKNAFL